RVLLASRDHLVHLADIATGRDVCRFVCSPGGFLAITPDNYYAASRGGLPGVYFRVGSTAYPFEQFDLKFNRPDIVLERVGLASPEPVASYREAYRKRLRRLHLTEDALAEDTDLPEVAVVTPVPFSTDKRVLRLTVRATDPKCFLDQISVS